MTSIPLILHYQPTLHIFTNLIQFCLILPGPYILAKNLNAAGPYILGQREYHTLSKTVSSQAATPKSPPQVAKHLQRSTK
jgi:hypothetical protein